MSGRNEQNRFVSLILLISLMATSKWCQEWMEWDNTTHQWESLREKKLNIYILYIVIKLLYTCWRFLYDYFFSQTSTNMFQ